MAGFGRFKLTDALPEQVAEIEIPTISGRRTSGLTRRSEARGKARAKTSRPVPRASRRSIADWPLNRFARHGRTIRPRTPKARFATGWSTSAGATSRPAASAPNDRHHRLPGRTVVDLGLATNVVVIFGAARGIGAAIAKAFAAEGAHVAAIDRDPSVHDLARPFPQSLSLMADVTDYRRGSPGSPGSRAPLR